MAELIQDILLGATLASYPVFEGVYPIWHCKIGIAGKGDSDTGSVGGESPLDRAIDGCSRCSEYSQSRRNGMQVDLIR